MRIGKEHIASNPGRPDAAAVLGGAVDFRCLPYRVGLTLRRIGVQTLGDLVKCDPQTLLGHRLFGRASLRAVEGYLAGFNLKLGVSSEGCTGRPQVASVEAWSLRDHLAGLAMAQIYGRLAMTDPDTQQRIAHCRGDEPFEAWVARCAYEMADAMLAERAKPATP